MSEPSSNPVIVFDESDSELPSAPIEICYRQPSFVRLQGEPIPKGFDSLDEFRAGREPVKADSIRDENSPACGVQKLLSKRNKEKWIKLGYDPASIETGMNRLNSAVLMRTNYNDHLQIKDQGKLYSSFSQIESVPINEPTCAPLPMAPLIEEESEIPLTKKLEKKPISRSLSSGIELPNLEYPMKLDDISESDEIESSDDSFIILLENGMPKHVSEIMKHPPSSIVYKALCGKEFKGLPYDVVTYITEGISFYMNECFENGYEAEAFHVQGIIENLRKSADKSQTPGNPGELPIDLYHSKVVEVFHEYEKKVEYYDTQSFLNEDNMKRAMKNLAKNAKNCKNVKFDVDVECAKIWEAYEATEAQIKQNRAYELCNLKRNIERLKLGVTKTPHSPPMPSIPRRKPLGRNVLVPKRNGLRSSTNTRGLIIKPQAKSRNKNYQ